VLSLGRDILRDFASASSREWLAANGIGGYAAGTVTGQLSRRYHGLLIAALQPPLGRTLLVAKLDETAAYDGQSYPLHTNEWRGDVVDPAGFVHIDRFYLDGAVPVWEFACADALIEKRIWMEPGRNTTYVRYQVRRASGPVTLTLKALVNSRDHHSRTLAGGNSMTIEPLPAGLRVRPQGGAAPPFYLLSGEAQVTALHDWYQNFYLAVEAYRGLEHAEDHLMAGIFQATLAPEQSLTMVLSTEPEPDLDGAAALARRQAHEARLLEIACNPAEPVVAQLVLAADQFIVSRPTPIGPEGRSVIAGYPWFGDWGRDTMIALPGLTLATNRLDEAATILRTYAHFVDQGMIPNRFPDEGEEPEYNTADATLWYLEAVRAYHAATDDDDLLGDLYPVLEEIVAWHRRGTRYGIRVDPADGLLAAGEPGVQLTWMDAKVGDWVVTPRMGKPVELSALWYNAARAMAEFARLLGKPADEYDALADQTQAGFERFWYVAGGYCYDVIDSPDGEDDASLRPNQLLAVSLTHSPLPAARQQAVVDVCTRRLLTPHGLRSLAADDPAYKGGYGGDIQRRDTAYHQGTVWAWLIGPFAQAHLRVHGQPAATRAYLTSLMRHLADHGVGSISEIFDGDPPFTPRGCIAQAWSVAELLRAWLATDAG
jgi:predicted glycogen debranching enzyme